jgi:hypothetical protein
VRELGDETLRKIAVEITDTLRRSTTVDWQSAKASARVSGFLVRRTLQRWRYPPDKTDGAVDLVLTQAEALSDRWSAPDRGKSTIRRSEGEALVHVGLVHLPEERRTYADSDSTYRYRAGFLVARVKSTQTGPVSDPKPA